MRWCIGGGGEYYPLKPIYYLRVIRIASKKVQQFSWNYRNYFWRVIFFKASQSGWDIS